MGENGILLKMMVMDLGAIAVVVAAVQSVAGVDQFWQMLAVGQSGVLVTMLGFWLLRATHYVTRAELDDIKHEITAAVTDAVAKGPWPTERGEIKERLRRVEKESAGLRATRHDGIDKVQELTGRMTLIERRLDSIEEARKREKSE